MSLVTMGYSVQETVRRLPGGVKRILVKQYLRKLPHGVELLKVNHEEPKQDGVIEIGDEVTLGMVSLEVNRKARELHFY